MDVLADLESLSAFVGARVALASPNSQLLPLLTHPSHTTFPWEPLKNALESYFGTPDTIDPARVQAGWAGLRCYIAAFKRLEAVNSEAETAEVMTWLIALRHAAIMTSLFSKAPETDMLYEVLANLCNPITAEDLPALIARAGSNTAQLPAWQNSAAASFERGSEALPLPTAKPTLPAVFHRPSLEALVSRTASTDKNQPTSKRSAPSVLTHISKRRRSASIEQISALARARDSTVSTSALSSFADFSDRAEDPEHGEEEEEDDDEYDQLADDEPTGSVASSTSSRNFLPARGPKSPASHANKALTTATSSKVELLAQRLSSVTGLPFAKCLETVARVPKEELNAVDPAAHMPSVLLPLAPAATVTSTKNVKRSHSDDREDGRKVVRSHDPNRPAFSYSALIGQAILSTDQKRMRLAEIYEYVTAHYPYYTKNECGWQNSIRHNLSLQPVFKKIPDVAAPGKKGCHWMILASEEWRFADGGWRKIDAKGGEKLKKDKEKKPRKSTKKSKLSSEAGDEGTPSHGSDDDE